MIERKARATSEAQAKALKEKEPDLADDRKAGAAPLLEKVVRRIWGKVKMEFSG
jgi:hypothetical protein